MPSITTNLQTYFIIFALTSLAVFLLTRAIIAIAPKFGWVANSDERSSHKGSLAFGGGAPIILLTLGTWFFFTKPFDMLNLVILFSALTLAIISAIDDLKLLRQSTRLIFQISTIAICLFLLPTQDRVFPFDLPLIIDRIITGLFWLWFINLFNFMDGIDGLASSETISIGLGIFLIAIFFSFPESLTILAIALIGSVAGFLSWNWHKAKIMLGDLGSIPIGFLLGFLLINLAIEGYFLAAIILPLYFLSDASITLLRRILTGKKFWQAHNEHFYQRAVQAGFGHDKITLKVILANILLILVAIFSIYQPIISVFLAAIIVAALIFHLSKLAKK